MARSSKSDAKIDTHIHLPNTEGFCDCGAERISNNEYSYRIAEWEQIYAKSKNTESGASFSLCREAFHKGDWGAVKAFAEAAKQRRLENNYIPKPKFKDPRLCKRETILKLDEPTEFMWII